MGGQREGEAGAGLTAADQDFLDRTTGAFVTAGLMAAAVALVLGVLATRLITRPVRALTKGAREIARGNLGHQVDIHTRDEIGELAAAFNGMSASLKKAEEQRKRLVSDVAHELRTPLTIIQGTVDAIRDGVFPADEKHLSAIREQTALLARLASDLREISLAEAGRLRLELAPVDLAELARDKVAQFDVRAAEKGIRLELETAPGLPKVNADRTRIDQVLANLLANAVRHTPSGGSIVVSVAPSSKPDSRGAAQRGVTIVVRDTGEGIAPEDLPHVFERFYRAEQSRSRGEGGFGLGLAIVKHLVQLHGGDVQVESEPRRGSTFSVFLPA